MQPTQITEKPRLSVKVLLSLLLIFHLTVNVIWITKNCFYMDLNNDHNAHLRIVLDLYNHFHAPQEILKNNLIQRPPLYHLLNAAFLHLVDPSRLTMVLPSTLWFLGLLLACYFATGSIMRPAYALFAVCLISVNPLILAHARSCGVDLPLTVAVTLFYLILLASSGPLTPKQILALLVVFLAGMLIKPQFLFFTGGAILISLPRIRPSQFWREVRKPRGAVLATEALLGIIFVVSILWYGSHIIHDASELMFRVKLIMGLIDPYISQWDLLLSMMKGFYNACPWFFLVSLFGFFIFLLRGRRTGNQRWLLMFVWVAAPLFLFTRLGIEASGPANNDRYLLPIYPAMVIMATYGFSTIPRCMLRRTIVTLILIVAFAGYFTNSFFKKTPYPFSSLSPLIQSQYARPPSGMAFKKAFDLQIDGLEHKGKIEPDYKVGILTNSKYYIPMDMIAEEIAGFLKFRYPRMDIHLSFWTLLGKQFPDELLESIVTRDMILFVDDDPSSGSTRKWYSQKDLFEIWRAYIETKVKTGVKLQWFQDEKYKKIIERNFARFHWVTAGTDNKKHWHDIQKHLLEEEIESLISDQSLNIIKKIMALESSFDLVRSMKFPYEIVFDSVRYPEGSKERTVWIHVLKSKRTHEDDTIYNSSPFPPFPGWLIQDEEEPKEPDEYEETEDYLDYCLTYDRELLASDGSQYEAEYHFRNSIEIIEMKTFYSMVVMERNWIRLIRNMMEQEKTEDALDLVKLEIPRPPDNPLYFYNMGEVLMDSERYKKMFDEAWHKKALDEALDSEEDGANPDWMNFCFRRQLFIEGRYFDEIHVSDGDLEMTLFDFSCFEPWYFKAMCYKALEEMKRRERCHEKMKSFSLLYNQAGKTSRDIPDIAGIKGGHSP